MERRWNLEWSLNIHAATRERLKIVGTDLGRSAKFRRARVRAGLALSRPTARVFVLIPLEFRRATNNSLHRFFSSSLCARYPRQTTSPEYARRDSRRE